MRSLVVACLASVPLVVACSQSSPGAADGGPKPKSDASADAKPLPKVDAATDAGPGPHEDGGPKPTKDAATDSKPGPEVDGGICALHHTGKTSDGDPVEICDRPFVTRPWVNPPPDDLSDPENVTIYGSVDVFGVPVGNPPFTEPEPTFYDRNYTGYVVVDSHGTPVFPEVSYPAGFEMPSPATAACTWCTE